MTKEQLIEGQWYRLDYYSRIYLFKYRKNGDKIATKGSYISNGRIEEASDNFAEDDICKYMTPADMNEVYKYFPEERPKAVGLEPGKWYKATCKGDKTKHPWLFKFKSLNLSENGLFHSYMSTKMGVSIFSETGTNYYENIVPADMEEVYKVFPKEKPQSIKEQFKVGDWVSWKGWNPLVAQIIRRSNYENCWVLNEKTHDSCDESNLFFATPEEIAKATKKEEPMNTYGLNVGDSLPSNIINKWANIEGNICREIKSGWGGTFSGYSPDRKIESFRLINGIVGFKVSGCAADTHYLKAESFKQFVEEFNKPPKTKGFMNTYGLQIGDVIKADVLTKWINLPSQNNCWEKIWKNYASVSNDSPIYEFKLIDGITVFRREIGKNADFWIKAEGFKEFAEGKEELTSLPEKWCIKAILTNPEYETLVNWRTAGAFAPNGYLMCEKYRPGTKGYWVDVKPEGYTEITFDQFKKWVLEQKTTALPTPLPILREGEYYTITNYMEGNPGEVMIGIVTKGNNGDNGSGSLRGNATFLSSGTKHFHIDAVWCYKDSGKRDFRLSTPEEIEWLKECIKADKYVPKPSPVMDTVGTMTGRGFPKFQRGDEVVVCSYDEDRNGWGYLNTDRESYTERINGVAGRKFTVTEICTYEGRYYYSLETGGWICEDCLSYQDTSKNESMYIGFYDPYDRSLIGDMKDFSESYKGSVELYSPKKEAIINPAVNTIRSVEVKLVKPKKVVLF